MQTTIRARRAAATLDDPRWQAVLSRDRAADGRFVYAVRTTGVYCRPSCPARLARPEHVAFHASAQEAERAGFRPCKRCRPDDAAHPHAARVAALCRHIAGAERPPRLSDLARRAGLSPWHLQRVFREVTGLTPKAWATAQRAARLRGELASGARVSAAAYAAGFGSSARLHEAARPALGMTPKAYRAGGRGSRIRFAIGACSLGAVLVAHSGRGICAIALGEDPEALLRELQDRFPHAELIGGDARFERLIAQVVRLIEAPRIGADLPLDLRGTAFQLRVWQALRAIPPGVTLSYAELARRIGVSGAARAVAGACAANPLAVAVPCHRVVRSDGTLAGYRWGIARKAALLARERAR